MHIRTHQVWRYATGALLLLQVTLLLLSFGPLTELSVFCTASRSAGFAWFGAVHALFAALLVLGCVALARPSARPIYIAVTIAVLPMLLAQAYLVHAGLLYCDAP